MKEYTNVRQIPGERRRRWFTSDNFDLIVWLNEDSSFAGFELCYDKAKFERSLIWRPNTGFTHMAVDSGEQRPGRYKATPVLVPDGVFDAVRIHSAFAAESAPLPREVVSYVLAALENHPEYDRAL